ncbi:hypothetical protein [Haloarcula rubripromontorii]|uniref:hypothetical protein n=1 Tax=Haloarcula rubripromontorii TaxID=1705562 RepID=UPI00345C35F0
MIRRASTLVLVAFVAVMSLAVPVVADEHGENTTTTPAAEDGETASPQDSEGNETVRTTSEDPALALEQSRFASVHEIQWRDGYALITVRTTQPVSVTYPTQGTGELDVNEAREVITTTERIPRGETTIRVELADGSAFATIDGATVVLSGEKQFDRGLVKYLSANESLLLGGAIVLSAATLAGYRQKQKDELDEPENAFRRGGER